MLFSVSIQPTTVRDYMNLIGVTNEALNTFEKELSNLLNSYSMENGSDTPDYMLAQYLRNCLENYNRTIVMREKWFGRYSEDNGIILENSCYANEDGPDGPAV